MKEKVFSLENYDLDNYYNRSHHYMKKSIDWDAIDSAISEKKVTAFPVIDSLNLFSHLTLDKQYELWCYVTKEYHGIWGRVAAVPTESDQELAVKTDLFGYPGLTLPNSAVPPMEALYHDGTAEGYFESVLCTQLFRAIPYVTYERDCYDHIRTEPPTDLAEQWNLHINLPDWTPKVFLKDKYCTVVACKYEHENGIGGSSGKSRIKLSEYSFWNKLSFHHCLMHMKKSGNNIYPSHIDNDDRYSDGRHCCVAKEMSILIAEQI